LRAAEFLLDHEATLNVLPGWGRVTPHDAAARSGATDVITWLHGHGARTASDLAAADHRRLPARTTIRPRNSGRVDFCVRLDRAGHAAGRDGHRP